MEMKINAKERRAEMKVKVSSNVTNVQIKLIT